MRNVLGIGFLLLAVVTVGLAQMPTGAQPQPAGSITGLYSFIHEGEFVQIEVSANGKVTGAVSCYKDEDQNKAGFVDELFEQAMLDGTTLSFRTKPVNGLWFEFSGTVGRGSGKAPSDEDYWNIKGTVIVRRTKENGRISEKTHEVTLKSFPQESDPSQDQRVIPLTDRN